MIGNTLQRDITLGDNVTIPDTYDFRDTNCSRPIRYKGEGCLSDWAISAADVLGDRFCKKRGWNVTLSAQFLLECSDNGLGCNGGGFPKDVWNFISSNGTVLEDC